MSDVELPLAIWNKSLFKRNRDGHNLQTRDRILKKLNDAFKFSASYIKNLNHPFAVH